MCVCASSRLSDVSCVAVVCSVGQREVPAGDYFSLGPGATALHQSLHWERPATGSQEFYTHTLALTQREEAEAEKPKCPEAEEYGGVFWKFSQTCAFFQTFIKTDFSLRGHFVHYRV